MLTLSYACIKSSKKSGKEPISFNYFTSSTFSIT